MDDKLFEELTVSIRQAGEIRREEKQPSRRKQLDAVNIAELRRSMGLTQTDLAGLIGVPVSTLRNWEQGRRTPRGPALALLTAVERDPLHVIKALSG